MMALTEIIFMGIFNLMRGRPPKTPEDRKTANMKIPLADGVKPVTWARDMLLKAAKRRIK